MHDWSDETVDWQGINDAAEFIGEGLRKWGRICVYGYKEKFGTVRVDCFFGWATFHAIVRPGYMWIPKWWPWGLDLFLSRYIFAPGGMLNRWFIVPFHYKLYRWHYKKAVEKWPHLREEILSAADYGEVLEGYIVGYKYSDYWRSLNDNTIKGKTRTGKKQTVNGKPKSGRAKRRASKNRSGRKAVGRAV